MSDPRVLATDLVIGESARWHDGRLGCRIGAQRKFSRSTKRGIARSPRRCPQPSRFPSIGCPTVSYWWWPVRSSGCCGWSRTVRWSIMLT